MGYRMRGNTIGWRILSLVLVVTVSAERRGIGRRVHHVRRYWPVGRISETGSGHFWSGPRWASALASVPQLPHFIPPLSHERLVLGYPHLFPVHYTSSLRPGPIPVVWVFFHVQLGQPGLFLVVRLFVRVRHSLPPSPCETRQHISELKTQILRNLSSRRKCSTPAYNAFSIGSTKSIFGQMIDWFSKKNKLIRKYFQKKSDHSTDSDQGWTFFSPDPP